METSLFSCIFVKCSVASHKCCLRIWNALTDNYGNVMPVDWKSSHTRTLHLLTLNLSEKEISDSLLFDTSDEEELREQLDMHSIIVSCVNDEPLFTADQVIEEIEEMMQESPDPEDDEALTQSDRLSMLSQEIQTLKRSSTSSYEERVKRLSVSELNELLEEIETAIKEYSEELVQQLALRDELEFEKEVKNSFISVLIEVQNKQKEHKETAKKKKKLKNGSSQNGKNERSHMPGTRFSMEGISNVIQNGLRHTFGNAGGEKQYLTTVIPYEKKNGPPSVEDLQILTKILRAMKEDSEKVPSLLTDYILKGRGGNEAGVQMKVVMLVRENEGVWNAQVFKGTGRCGYGASFHPSGQPAAS
ncbi:Fasciculation and elongation protein zeta-2 [Myotis brandtii]|uniref:Fasciculation and elongation protein zeta-2 n=1 Tax=Myotis brandtii TaxID=109478 RepID=S7NTF9_MYOBR|nr:Fasciculation and elongation protein zeta-2 [Myotis brandtii]